MRTFICLIIIGLLAGVFGIFPNVASAQIQCKYKASIDYVGMWGPYYDACASEMKTTFEYNISAFGSYRVIWCQVDNTPYSEQYWAGVICETPPCSGSIVAYTHCSTSSDHRLLMDVETCSPNEIGFVYPFKLTAEYYLYTPD